MKNKHYLIFGILLALSYLLGRSQAPTKIVEVEKEKVIYKSLESSESSHATSTTLTTTIKPNGTKITKLKKTYKDKSKTLKTSASQMEKEKEKITSYSQNTYIGILYNNSSYAIQAHQKIIGPLHLGLLVNTQKNLLLSIGLSF